MEPPVMSPRLRLTASVLAGTLLAAGCADDVPTRPAAVADAPSTSTYVNVHTVLGAGGALFGLNTAGVMVGFNPVAGVPRAYVYSPTAGTATLVTLNAATKVIPARDTAFNVNRAGQIVGTSNNAAGAARPVLWATAMSTPQDLGTAGPGYALDINASGAVVGWWSNAGSPRAFVWTSGGGLVDPLGGVSGKARGINDSGVVVGEVSTAGGLRAFRWSSGGGLQVLGTLGGTSSVANDIGPNGRTVGASTTSAGHTHAFIWWPEFNRMDDLGTLGGTESVATGTVDHLVVGYSTTTPGGPRHPFAWRTRTQTMRDQGTGGGTQATMRAVNAYGRAVGDALDTGGASSRVHWQLTEVNTNPTVFFTGAPPTVDEDAPAVFSYTAADDEDALRYVWTFGNGTQIFTYPPTQPSVSRAYAEHGVYPVRVIVYDPSGWADTATTTVTVVNQPPTGTLTTPADSILERSAYILSVTGISDAATDMKAGIQASFTCGGGVWSAYNPGVANATSYGYSCTAPNDQTSTTVGVRLRDKDGALREYTRVFVVYNVPPVVSIVAVTPTTFTLGQSFTAQGSFTDPGPSDAPYRFRFTWGDGRRSEGILNSQGAVPPVPHGYLAAGTYLVTLSVTDEDGGTGVSSTLTVTVNP
jgi:probable HAF family extracellular repeat protein